MSMCLSVDYCHHEHVFEFKCLNTYHDVQGYIPFHHSVRLQAAAVAAAARGAVELLAQHTSPAPCGSSASLTAIAASAAPAAENTHSRSLHRVSRR